MQIVPGSDDDVPGEFSINPKGLEAKELAKFEQFKTPVTDRKGVTTHFKPGRPWEYQEYPKMLYKAIPNPRAGGKVMCGENEPQPWMFDKDELYQRAVTGAVAFTQACQRTVGSQAEESLARAAGWCESPAKAMDAHSLDKPSADFIAAAHRAHDDRNMSDAAKAEARAQEVPGEQLLEVKEARKVKKAWTPERRAAQAKTLAAKKNPVQAEA